MLNSFGYTPERKLAHSKNWYERGMEHLEEMRYDDALVCFGEARRFGHPQSAKAIALCHQRLREI